jgi:lantibiotic biosynthesis protein
MHESKLGTASHLSRITSASRPRVPWQSFLEEPLKAQVEEVVFFVAERLRDRESLKAFMSFSEEEMAEIAEEQSTLPTPPSPWFPTDLGSGDLGIAFMYAYLDICFPGQSWDALAQRYLKIAAAETQESQLDSPGVFHGTTGMALALVQASKGGKRYQKTLAHVHEGLSEQVLARSWRDSEVKNGVACRNFDIISGAAGILAYLVSIKQADSAIQQAISCLLDYLVWLCEPGQPLGQERWYIPPALLPNDSHRQVFPRGNFNCGMAHGIPGPLAALSLTWQAGYHAPGLHETIAYLANWVIEHRSEQEWGIDWPDSIPLEVAGEAHEWQRLSPTRAAWCYGAPGVARSLWLAGYALEDEAVRARGVEAIESALRRQIAQRDIFSPILCHGTAGLLHICLRFAHECESTLAREQIPVLVKQILDAFNPSFPLGFRNTEQSISVDLPGWLGGAPGIAMVLLAAATDVTPTWDRALAIA